MFTGGKKLNVDQARQIALAMESADKNFHGIAVCSDTTAHTVKYKPCQQRKFRSRKKTKNHVFDVTASTYQIIVASGMQPATSARK